MKVTSNTLVKILVPSALALAVLIGIKSCQRRHRPATAGRTVCPSRLMILTRGN